MIFALETKIIVSHTSDETLFPVMDSFNFIIISDSTADGKTRITMTYHRST